MDHEHDDDLSPSVDERSEVETEDFPSTADELEDDTQDDEPDDEDIIGK